MVKKISQFILSFVVVSMTTALIIVGVCLWMVGLAAPCWLLADFEQYSTPARIAATVLVLSWAIGWVAATVSAAQESEPGWWEPEAGAPCKAPRPNAPPPPQGQPPRKRVTVGEA
jgi:type VI protein secretion system component VasK